MQRGARLTLPRPNALGRADGRALSARASTGRSPTSECNEARTEQQAGSRRTPPAPERTRARQPANALGRAPARRSPIGESYERAYRSFGSDRKVGFQPDTTRLAALADCERAGAGLAPNTSRARTYRARTEQHAPAACQTPPRANGPGRVRNSMHWRRANTSASGRTRARQPANADWTSAAAAAFRTACSGRAKHLPT